MNNYDIVPQEKNNYCVCSVLQAIFKKYSIEISQNEIANSLTPSEKGFEVYDKNIKNFIESLGFEYEFYWRNETPLNEPELVLENMIAHQGFIGINDHTYLFVDYKYPNVKMIDPEKGKLKTKEYHSMIKEMYDYKKGFFGLIKKVV